MSSKAVFHKNLISAASAAQTTGVLGPSFTSQVYEVAFHIQWGTGVSAGVVKIEAAHDAAYTGTWAPLATVTYASGSPIQDIVQITGCAAAYRARISTAVVGGTVSVDAVGN